MRRTHNTAPLCEEWGDQVYQVYRVLLKLLGIPTFNGLSPVKGPLEGGTLVTISMTNQENLKAISVQFGSLSVAVET